MPFVVSHKDMPDHQLRLDAFSDDESVLIECSCGWETTITKGDDFCRFEPALDEAILLITDHFDTLPVGNVLLGER